MTEQEEAKELLEQVLERFRTDIDARFPQYARDASILIERDSNANFQPSTDYNIFILIDGTEQGDLERIAAQLPVRFSEDGSTFTVHVTSTTAYLEKHLEALDR